MRETLRVRHYSLRTEQAYIHWTKRFIYFHGKRHPRELGPKDVEAFLTYLAVEGRVSASTQGQALAALLFLYKQVLEIELPWLDEVVRAKRPQRVPTVLTPDEVVRLLACLDGTHALMANLLYGTGMRLMECLRLRVKDVDLSRREITIRASSEAQGSGLALTHFCLTRRVRASYHLMRGDDNIVGQIVRYAAITCLPKRWRPICGHFRPCSWL
jgi:integrase